MALGENYRKLNERLDPAQPLRRDLTLLPQEVHARTMNLVATVRESGQVPPSVKYAPVSLHRLLKAINHDFATSDPELGEALAFLYETLRDLQEHEDEWIATEARTILQLLQAVTRLLYSEGETPRPPRRAPTNEEESPEARIAVLEEQVALLMAEREARQQEEP
ncbi:hypothetical protein ACH4FX_12400 [Streptomyces sp. NPDC018019]|uniref:hypothetical protein n=1 Tax=Streptomyces sp. NPDC018019 TaxID=3365030 RepID=UPI00379E68C6